MLHRRNILVLGLFFGVVCPALASAFQNYDMSRFIAAEEANAPIVLHVYAPWCTTCQAQKPILEKLAQSSKYKDIQFFVVDFDTQKEVLKKLDVTKQSVLIVLKGKNELGRSIGDTSPSSIEKLIDKSL